MARSALRVPLRDSPATAHNEARGQRRRRRSPPSPAPSIRTTRPQAHRCLWSELRIQRATIGVRLTEAGDDGIGRQVVVVVTVTKCGDLFFRLVLADSVRLLHLADQLVTLATDYVELVVGELAPLFLGLALQLLPVAFDTIPIQVSLLAVWLFARRVAAPASFGKVRLRHAIASIHALHCSFSRMRRASVE